MDKFLSDIKNTKSLDELKKLLEKKLIELNTKNPED